MSGCRKCREAAFSNWARELHLGIIGWGVVIYSSCSSLICCYISNLCDIGAARRSTLLTIFVNVDLAGCGGDGVYKVELPCNFGGLNFACIQDV